MAAAVGAVGRRRPVVLVISLVTSLGPGLDLLQQSSALLAFEQRFRLPSFLVRSTSAVQETQNKGSDTAGSEIARYNFSQLNSVPETPVWTQPGITWQEDCVLVTQA